MLVVFPVSHKDHAEVRRLLEWIVELGPQPNHQFLIVASRTLEMDDVTALHALAKKSFPAGTAIRLQEEDPGGWPSACNKMFRTAAEWVAANGTGHWLWVEGDCTPMFPGWLDALDAEYQRVGKPFVGCNFPHPFPHLNGGMLYPRHVRRFNPAMMFDVSNPATGKPLPWDLSRPDLTLRNGHNTRLIQRSLVDPKTNGTHNFDTMDEVAAVVWKECAMFHGCRNGSLLARLREQRGNGNGSLTVTRPAAKLNLVTSATNVVRKVKDVIRGTPAYYHSGNLGDVVYALYAIQLHLKQEGHSEADLVIGPEQRETAKCSNPINQAQFDLLLPLLKAQSYLRKVTWRSHHPGTSVTHDLNRFRNMWQDPGLRARTNIQTLCQMHCHFLGVANRFDHEYPWLAKSLEGQAIYTGKIIAHRSPRYHSVNFPWRELVEKYADKMLFVGLHSEYQTFQQSFGRVAFYQVRDFWEMARVVAGGCACVMNQSMPCALAIGAGQRVLQETDTKAADCLFNRPERFMSV